MAAKKKTSRKKVAAKKKAKVKKKPIPKLTDKQRLFVHEYLIDMNATQAAIRAGYSSKPESASAIGTENLSKPLIKAAIAKAMESRIEETQIDANWLLKRLAEEVEADVADLYGENGGMKPVHQWPEIWRKGLVAGLDVHQEYSYEDGQRIPDGLIMKLKLSDRVKRLEMIGKHINVNAFQENINHTGKIDGYTEDQLDERIKALSKREA